MRYDGTDDNYIAKLKYALLAKKERARFPDDAEFAESFSTRPVYLMNSKNKIYVLERLENFGTAEDKDVYRHFDDGTYSIEHIMPQHLTPACGCFFLFHVFVLSEIFLDGCFCSQMQIIRAMC